MSASEHLQPKQFFHGTNREFAPGDRIIPPSQGGHPQVMPEVSNPDHVYVSTDPKEAQSYAAFAAERRGGKAHVYEVKPRVHFTDPNDNQRPEQFRTAYAAPWAEVVKRNEKWSL